jgi:hypothetical protein
VTTHGTPHAPYLPARVRDRLVVTELTPGVFCWLWQGARNASGYGATSWGASTLVHRSVLAAYGVPLRAGHVVDHVCHDPQACPGGVSCAHRLCANPLHLTQIPRPLNTSSGRSSRAWHDGRCARGHDVTLPGAVYVPPSGRRACRSCRRGERAQARGPPCAARIP